MTKEELRTHCMVQIDQIETWARWKGEIPHGKVYEEHKFILELLDENKLLVETLNDCSRKRGKWIKIGDRGFGVTDTVICKCSECEYKTEFRGKFDGHKLVIDPKHAHKYCPSCGSKMENGE